MYIDTVRILADEAEGDFENELARQSAFPQRKSARVTTYRRMPEPAKSN
jgi:hypothetical protein